LTGKAPQGVPGQQSTGDKILVQESSFWLNPAWPANPSARGFYFYEIGQDRTAHFPASAFAEISPFNLWFYLDAPLLGFVATSTN
jgi:hypothetical protein